MRPQDNAQVNRGCPEEGISAGQLSQLDQTNQCIEATGAAQSEQLGGATRPSTRRPCDGFRERRLDAASVVLAAETAQAWEEQKLHSNRLHQTCGPVNDQRHVCVEKCPLTMRHVAKRSGDSCGESKQSFGGIKTWRPRRYTRSMIASVPG